MLTNNGTGGVAKKRTVPSEDTFEYRQLLNDNTSYRQAAFISRKGAPSLSSQELVTETEIRAFKIKKSVLLVSGYCQFSNNSLN